MQLAPQRSSNNIGRVADGGTCTLSKKSSDQNNQNFCRKDHEVSAIILRNSDRFFILTLVTFEHDPHLTLWAPLVLPLQGSDQRNCLGSGADVKIDGLEGSANKRTKAATVSNSSNQQNGNSSNESSDSRHDGFASTAADLVKEFSKVDKPSKKSNRKKVKKKGRRKPPRSSCNNGTAVVSEQGIHGISNLETCSSSGSALMDGCSLENILSENATPYGVPLKDSIMEKVNHDESGNDTVNCPTTTSKATPCSDYVDVLEIAASLPQDSTGDDFVSNWLGVDERPSIVTTSTIQTTNITLSGFCGEVSDVHQKDNSAHDEITFGLTSEEYSVPAFDSFSDGWNSDGDTNGSGDVNNELAIRKDIGKNSSENGVVFDCSNCGTSFHDVTSRKGTCGTSCDSNNEIFNSGDHWSKVVVDTKNNSSRTRCGSSSDGFSVISGKKGRKGRKSSVSSNGTQRISSGVNVHGWAGKESNHSVWQKVQKIDIDKCICELKDIDPVCLQFDASKKSSSFARHDTFMGLMENDYEKSTISACLDGISARKDVLKMSSTTDGDAFSLKSEYERSGNKVAEKLKREHISGSKQENGHNSRNGSHASKAISVRPTKMNKPKKEALDILLPVNNEKNFGPGSRSSSCSSTDSSDYSSSEPLQYSQTCSEKARSPGDVIDVTSDMNAQALQNRTTTLSTLADSLKQLEVESDGSNRFCKDKPGDFCLQTCNENGPAELETYISQVENSMSDQKCESILQMLISVGRKDAEALDNLSNSHLDDPFSDRWNQKRTGEEQLSVESHCHVPLTNAGVTRVGPSSGSLNYGFPEDAVTSELRFNVPVFPKEHIRMHISSTYLPIHKSNDQDISVNQTDLSKVSQAVNDAYRMQIESEGVGSPLPDFERLLHSASPVLDQTFSVRHCNACSGDQLIGDSLCRHQTPNVSLGSLWRWYEMPGSFGLEVKVEDYQKFKRFGSDCFQFRAYFVPFLSAVQLFGHSRSYVDAGNAVCNAEFRKGYDVDSTSEYPSHFNCLPIFSVPLSQPCREEETDLPLPVNLLSTSDSLSASGRDEVYKLSVSSAPFSEPELLFEYFESEQPQQRRPLFEKIQELVRGNATSNSQIFGDPLKLECLHLHDLHPSSWYSVAWYPIYRIPDGNLRAAFLTYHSLGHFVHRSDSSGSIGGGASIVSPVVGLQSYNAQDECWFQLRNSMATRMEGSHHFNPSKVLKERLRTLEQTAHVMARASVHKGDRKSINRQPDFEFFLSRRR